MLFDKQWFLTHQKILLWFCNTPLISIWFRWILCINGDRSSVGNRKIVEIYPHAIRWLEKYKYSKRYGRITVYSIEFRTHDKFGKRLYYALKPFWYLIHIWDILFANNWQPEWNLGFDSFGPVYPDPNPETTTFDGRARRAGVNEIFATIRAGAGNAVADSEASDAAFTYLEATTTNNQYADNSRGLFLYDTSTLADNAIISAATLSLWGTVKANGLGSPAIHIGAATTASNTGATNSDYENRGTTSFANITYANWLTTPAYNDFSLDANGIANISKTGVSKFSSQLSWDILNDTTGLTWASAASSYHVGYYADNGAGTTNDPKLVITYTLPPTSGSSGYKSLLGVGQA